MNKERIKSFVLVLLVIVNLLLAEKILVNKKLWPSGYNFFNIGNSVKKNDYYVADRLAVPQKIIINTGYQSSRFEYNRNDRDFTEILSAANDTVKKAFLKPLKSVNTISSDDWYYVLTSKSVYLHYTCNYSASVFSKLLGISSTELDFESFSDIIISENGNVYFSDKNGSAFYRISTFSDSIMPIIQNADNSNHSEETVINYSFDLNFDKNLADWETTLSPMILIYSDAVTAELVTSSNPMLRDTGFNNRIISNILSAFRINPNTIRRHTEADGSLVFVENNGILRISADGVISFTAANTGIKLSDFNLQDTYSTVSELAEFIDAVNTAIGIDSDMCVTSPLTEQNTEKLTFDYIINGIPIKFSDGNAVSAVVKDGYIKEYTQILRKYSNDGTDTETLLYIEAIDKVITQYQNSMKEIKITDMFPAYLDDKSIGDKYPDWYVKIDNIIAQ